MATQSSGSISERIIKAAAVRFMADGYEGTSMLAVARDAKTSKRAIYAEFGSKEALFENVMGYLCSLGDDVEDKEQNILNDAQVVTLEGQMNEIANAVITRFLLPETRGVLVAAIGASAKFPQIPNLFWDAGPGQAVVGLTELFLSSDKVNCSDPGVAKQIAHRFLMSCVAPFTLSYLFDPDFKVTKAEIDQTIDNIVKSTISKIA